MAKRKSSSKRTPNRLLLAFDGWMDGGEVSTGTVAGLVDQLEAVEVEQIDSDQFYIFNFPGPMEIAGMFRPEVHIVDGMVKSLGAPTNSFYHSEKHHMYLFLGREPNLHWYTFAETMIIFAMSVHIKEIYFVGSFAGSVPHTREPRLFCTTTHRAMANRLESLGMNLSNYEGPASFATYLLDSVKPYRMWMANISAEIPSYVEGRNAKCIEAVTRKIANILELGVPMDKLRAASDEWERKVNEAVGSRKGLGKHIHKLEEAYDHEIFDTQMGDLKDWLKEKGIRLD